MVMTEETTSVRPELPEGYYLDNFQMLLDYVVDYYNDMLKEEEKAFYQGFGDLSRDSQLLFTRLVTRKGPYFRKTKLNYLEIEDIEQAIKDLSVKGFIELEPPGDLMEKITIFTRGELIQVFSGFNQETLTELNRKKKILNI